MTVHVFYSLAEGLALDYKQGYEFRGVRAAGRHLGEMHVLVEEFTRELVDVHYLRHRADSKAPEVGVHDERLRIGVADDADSGCRPFELVERRLELGAEIRILEIVDGAHEAFLLAECCHTSPAGAEV